MFSEDAEDAEQSTSSRLMSWAGRVIKKAPQIGKQIKGVQSAVKDMNQTSIITGAKSEANKEDTTLGMPTTYVYVGAGLLIAAGIGYIAYNRTRN